MSQDRQVKRITITYTDGTAEDLEMGMTISPANEGFVINAVGLSPNDVELLTFDLAKAFMENHYQFAKKAAEATAEELREVEQE